MIEAVTFICHTPTCAWLDRPRPLRLTMAMIGPGLFATSTVICECGSPPERQASMMVPDVRKLPETAQ
jgi:hypothetical protein